MSLSAENIIFRMLDTVGDGSGVYEMAAPPSDYYIIPASNERFFIHRINIIVVASRFRAERYGNAKALENGIEIYTIDDQGNKYPMTPIPIKTSFQWGLQAGVDVRPMSLRGNDALLIRWTIAKTGEDLSLRGARGERLVFSIRDNLQDARIVSHLAQAQGFLQRV